MAKKKEVKKNQEKNYFVQVLAIVSILGFAGIISQSWFNYEIGSYLDALILLVLGAGIVLEAEPKTLFNKRAKVNNRNFSRLTTFIIGGIALLAGFLSFPFIGLEHYVFLSIKGVVAFIAIIFIAAQTWLLKE